MQISLPTFLDDRHCVTLYKLLDGWSGEEFDRYFWVMNDFCVNDTYATVIFY